MKDFNARGQTTNAPANQNSSFCNHLVSGAVVLKAQYTSYLIASILNKVSTHVSREQGHISVCFVRAMRKNETFCNSIYQTNNDTTVIRQTVFNFPSSNTHKKKTEKSKVTSVANS